MKFKDYMTEATSDNANLNRKQKDAVKGLKEIGVEVFFTEEGDLRNFEKQRQPKRIEFWTIVVNSRGNEISIRPAGDLVKITGSTPVITQRDAKSNEAKSLSKTLEKAAREYEFIRERLAPFNMFSLLK